MNTNQDLAGRLAIVTGGAGGLGRAQVIELAGRGAHVAVVDVDDSGLADAKREFDSAGLGTSVHRVDVTDRKAIEEFVESLLEQHGGVIDAVVNTAGAMFTLTGLEGTDDVDFQRTLEVNVHGALHLTRAALPGLRKSTMPRVVIISSQWGQVPDGHSYGYMVAKAAQLGLMKTMAKEFTPEGILINAITPGAIRTRMVPEERIEDEIAALPIGRLGEPEDIAGAVGFLVSEKSSFVSGQVLAVNGGACIVGI